MFKGLFRGIAGLFGRGPYQIDLDRQGNQLRLKACKGKKAVPVTQVVEKCEQLESLKSLQPFKDMLIIPISRLTEVKQVLGSLDRKRFEVQISEDADKLQPVSMPDKFEVRHVWKDDLNYVQHMMPDGAAYLGEGWFIREDAYWQVEETSEDDDKWLRMEAITGQDILTLLTRKAAEWKTRGLPYTCAVSFHRQRWRRESLRFHHSDTFLRTISATFCFTFLRSITSRKRTSEGLSSDWQEKPW